MIGDALIQGDLEAGTVFSINGTDYDLVEITKEEGFVLSAEVRCAGHKTPGLRLHDVAYDAKCQQWRGRVQIISVHTEYGIIVIHLCVLRAGQVILMQRGKERSL